MNALSTGNDLVDAMGQVPITGNATPLAWYRTIVRGDGKADRLAIDLLAHLVWWYRPYEARDEQMGFAGMRKKFRGELYQCSYRTLGEILNAPERSIRRSLELLESLGVARREIRPLRLADGAVIPSVLFIAIDPGRIEEVSRSPIGGARFSEAEAEPMSHMSSEPLPTDVENSKTISDPALDGRGKEDGETAGQTFRPKMVPRPTGFGRLY